MKFRLSILVFLVVVIFTSPVSSIDPEQRFRIDITYYSNSTAPSVESVSIVEARQISAFSTGSDYKLEFVDEDNETLKEYFHMVGFETIIENFNTGEERTITEDERNYVLFTEYFETAKNLKIFDGDTLVKNVNLKEEICGKSPCHGFCSDVINQSKLDSCEVYDGFNEKDEGDGDQGNNVGENKHLQFNELLIFGAIVMIALASFLYYRRKSKKEIGFR